MQTAEIYRVSSNFRLSTIATLRLVIVILFPQAVTPLCDGIARPSALVSHAAGVHGIAILACPPQPEPSIPARSSLSALVACRPSVHVSYARGHTSPQFDYYIIYRYFAEIRISLSLTTVWSPALATAGASDIYACLKIVWTKTVTDVRQPVTFEIFTRDLAFAPTESLV